MNTFTKSVFLMLAAGSVSAHTLNNGGSLRAQVEEATAESPPSECVPDERPQTKNKKADKTRFRFNFEKSDAVCADDSGLEYEWGKFKKASDSDECADMCTNDTTTKLANVLRGFNFDCDKEECYCLYDMFTLDSSNTKSFSDSNYRTRNAKGEGSISRTVKEKGNYCFKLVGAELTGEGLEMLHKTQDFLNSFN